MPFQLPSETVFKTGFVVLQQSRRSHPDGERVGILRGANLASGIATKPAAVRDMGETLERYYPSLDSAYS